MALIEPGKKAPAFTLNDQDATGFEWLAKGSLNINGNNYNSEYGTVGGLTLSTLLTLVVVPVVYTYLDPRIRLR